MCFGVVTMSNILKLSELLGLETAQHEYELNGRTILYGDPSLESLPALAKLGSDENTGGSFANLHELARTTLRGMDFKDGEGFDEEWFDGVPFADFLHFLRFRQNPDSTGAQTEAGDPFELEVRGNVVRFAPVTLADVRLFSEFLAQDGATQADYLLAQLDRIFENARLTDDSPVPETLSAKLSLVEVQGLIAYWVNREKGEQKNAVKTTGRGKKKKAATGRKSAPSSQDTSATPSSPEPTDTSVDSPSDS